MSTNYIAPIWRMPRNLNNVDSRLSNYSINLANANERISLTDGVDLGVNSTVSLWVNFSTNNNSVILADDVNPSSSGYFVLLNTSTGDTYVRIGSSFGSTPFNTSWNLNQWYNIIIVRQGDTVELFKDNVSLGTRSGYGTTNTTKFDCIGAKNDQTFPMYGQISQVVAFNYALSTNQRNYIYNLNNPMAITGAEPVAYWPLGDNSNPNAPGSFPNISVGADSVFDFNGSSSQFINNGYFNELDNSDLSFSIWLKKTNTDYAQVVDSQTAGNSGILIAINSSDQVFVRVNTLTASTTTSGFANIGFQRDKWQNIILTYNNTTRNLIVYLNNQSVSNTTGSLTTKGVSLELKIGGVSGSYFTGQISNAQIWNTELSSSDVTTLYNNGQPLLTGTQPQEANLKSWYKLNQSANWEADTANTWQVPDNRSAYPQSITFLSPTSVNSPGYYNFTGDFTVSVWAKAHDPIASTYGMIFAIGNPSFSPPAGPGAYFGFQKSGLKFIWDDSDTGVYRSSNNTFQYEEWVHIVLVKSGTTLQYYINGQADPLTGTSTVGVQGQLTLGRWLGNSAYRLDGNISNFQFWDIALSAAQALTLYNDGTPLTSAIETENLQGWWKLDGTSTWNGSNWEFADLSGNAQTLTSSAMNEQNLANDNVSVLNGESSGMNTTNLVQSNLTRTQPFSNYSMFYDAVDVYSTFDTQISLGASDNFTWSFWIKPVYNSISDMVLMRASATSITANNTMLLTYSGGNWRIKWDNASGNFQTGYVMPNNEWSHVALSITQGTGTRYAYINGVQDSANAAVTGITSQWLGFSSENTTNDFEGYLSQCAYWDTNLSTTELAALYNNGVPQDLRSFSVQPTQYWPMNQEYSYWDGSVWINRDIISGNDCTVVNTAVISAFVGNAPGSEANGTGTNLAIADLKGNMSSSDKNAYSINMADYADGVTNPANSGRSTDVP